MNKFIYVLICIIPASYKKTFENNHDVNNWTIYILNLLSVVKGKFNTYPFYLYDKDKKCTCTLFTKKKK